MKRDFSTIPAFPVWREERLEVGSKLGSGGQGVVYAAVDTSTGDDVVVKHFVQDAGEDDDSSASSSSSFNHSTCGLCGAECRCHQAEINMATLTVSCKETRYINRGVAVVGDPQGLGEQAPRLVMERAPGVPLSTFLEENADEVDDDVTDIATQLVGALVELKSLEIVRCCLAA